MKIEIPGFPTCRTVELAVPHIAELMTHQFFRNAPLEQMLVYADAWERSLASQAPLRGDRRFVTVRSEVTLLQPHLRSHTHPAAVGEQEWHVDGTDEEHFLDEPDHVHIYIAHSTALTRFMVDPVVLEFEVQPSLGELNRAMKERVVNFNHAPILPGCFYSFDLHYHSAVGVKETELRYMMRVRETNNPDVVDNTLSCMRQASFVWSPYKRQELPSIKKSGNCLELYTW